MTAISTQGARRTGNSTKDKFAIRRAQTGIQRMGGFLSGMVMPVIGVFIAWGLITAFVIPTGWTPNAYLAQLVGPTITYLLPLLIGYTGGYKIYGKRGGAIGALATMGVIIGADITMLIGGMVMGPLAALALKHVDRLYAGKVKAGLEMLVDNFVLGILGAVLMIIGFVAVEPIFAFILGILSGGVNGLTSAGLIPLLSIFVAPAQVLFLNNAINHGIMIPLGIEQATTAGKSILFLVEANGGPWVGLLAAFIFFGKGIAKKTSPAAFIIMLFGGIGEVAFPYVLIKPILILAPIFGSMTGLFIFTTLGGGTVGPVSPGSIIALIAMSPGNALLVNILGYTASAVVSFVIASFFLRIDKTQESPEDLAAEADLPAAENATIIPTSSTTPVPSDHTLAGPISRLALICDAGMGSSVMGSSLLKTKVRKAMLDIEVLHGSIDDIPDSIDVVVTNKVLEDRVRGKVGDPNMPIWTIENFLDSGEYDRITARLREANGVPAPEKAR